MAGQYPSQPPPRNFSPAPRTDSPQNAPPGSYQPAIKRQQLSPSSGSPYNSPGINNIALPNQIFSSPYYGAQANGASASNSYNPYSQQQQQHPPRVSSPHSQNDSYGSLNSPQPRLPNSYTPGPYSPTPYNPYTNSSAPNVNPAINNNYNTLNTSHPPPHPGPMGNMGPPSRPPAAEKNMDVNDLTDVISGSGIDLKVEEENLITYSRPSRQTLDNNHNSFDSRNNFYSHNVPGGRDTFYGAGTFNQPAGPPKSAEEIAKEARQRVMRRRAEIKSYHLNEPFVYAACLKQRLDNQAMNAQAKVPTHGVYLARPGAAPKQLVVYGPDKNEVLKMVSGQSLLANESEYVEFLSLLSLAAEERIRGLVEEAAILAKGRRVGSHGIVPADMIDLAVGKGATETANGLPTPGNSAVSPTGNTLKRSYADMNNPRTPVSLKPNIHVSRNPIAQHINNIAQKERQQEIARLEKRQRRADTNRSDPMALGTPGASGGNTPDMETKKSSKAKDQKDAAAKKVTEAQQHAATTKTMNMALGLGGVMGKKLSWMKGASDAAPSNPYLPKANTNASNSKAGGPGVNGVGSSLPKTRMLGDSREDHVRGAGIQMRDMICVLEHDGKEGKALQRAYHMQGRVKR